MANLRNKRGRYHAEFYDPNRQPKRKWVALHTKDKQTARQKLVDLERKEAMDLYDPWEEGSPKQQITIPEAKESFLKSRSDLRPRSLEKYESVIRLFAESLPPGFSITYVEASHVEKYLRESNLSKTSEHVYYRHLHAFLNWCEQRGLIKTNPIAETRAPKLPKKQPRFLTPEQIQRILDAIEEQATSDPYHRDGEIIWLKDVILFAVGTGLRRSEITRLQWQDVTLAEEEGWITVRSREDAETKSGHERMVPLVGSAFRILRRKAAQRDDLQHEEYVFTGTGGDPLNPGYMSKQFLRYRREAGLPEGISFHTLRHTCASWLVQKGVSLKIVQEILGHSSSAVTERYAHLAPEALSKEMKRALKHEWQGS